VTAYSAIRAGESIVFAMEYVEGHDLSQLVKGNGPLPVAHACNFIYQAALGLQYAHEKGMVHRDIKPSNLILARHGNKPVVKVLDFGLAKATREGPMDKGLTHEGQMLGTPDYIAPEQSLDAQKADIRADIYSLGCTLYYLLSGGAPFQAASLYELLQAHHSMEARPLNLVRPEVPWELAAVVGKMLAKEPARRYQSPSEVAQALKPFFKAGETGPVGAKTELSQLGQPPPAERVPQSGPSAATNVAPAASERTAGKTVASMQPEPMWESLVQVSEEGLLPEPVEPASPPRGWPRPRWLWPAVAAGVLLLGLAIAWAAGVFKVKTEDGVIVLENVPENAVVEREGQAVRQQVKPATVLQPVRTRKREGQAVRQCHDRTIARTGRADLAGPHRFDRLRATLHNDSIGLARSSCRELIRALVGGFPAPFAGTDVWSLRRQREIREIPPPRPDDLGRLGRALKRWKATQL